MIDWDRVAELREEIGPEDFGEIVDLFVTEVSAAIEELHRTPPHPKAVEEQMHFLKGAALNLGFADLVAICREGEERAAAGDPFAVTAAQVRDSFERSRDEFLEALPRRFAA